MTLSILLYQWFWSRVNDRNIQFLSVCLLNCFVWVLPHSEDFFDIILIYSVKKSWIYFNINQFYGCEGSKLFIVFSVIFKITSLDVLNNPLKIFILKHRDLFEKVKVICLFTLGVICLFTLGGYDRSRTTMLLMLNINKNPAGYDVWLISYCFSKY
mgnify:FL=1